MQQSNEAPGIELSQGGCEDADAAMDLRALRPRGCECGTTAASRDLIL